MVGLRLPEVMEQGYGRTEGVPSLPNSSCSFQGILRPNAWILGENTAGGDGSAELHTKGI